MALDKVVDSATLDAGMTAVADAIRAKAGTTEPLAWPDGFKAAIEAISGGAGTGLAYDMGEFVLDYDTLPAQPIAINHNFGDTPEFVLVWTDDFAGMSADSVSSKQCNIGYCWLKDVSGLKQRLSSSATGDGLTVNLTLNNNDYRISIATPNSKSYLAIKPTDTAFYIHKSGNSNYWRAGVTYKYFVSKAWWNIGGVASAE